MKYTGIHGNTENRGNDSKPENGTSEAEGGQIHYN